MKKIVKIIGAAGAVALAAGLVPYHFKSDKESGEFELGGLLWNLKKTTGEEEDTYTIVGFTESDPMKLFISAESPIGRALVGAHVGDVVEANTPGGILKLKVLEIKLR